MIGKVEVIAGCMFSGKTEELIRRIRRAQIGRQGVLVFKPAVDIRYAVGEIVAHCGPSMPAIVVQKAEEIYPLALREGPDVVAIDEAQFFDAGIVDICRRLASSGARVIVAGLNMDFRGEPFGFVPQLMAIADGGVTMLTAVCTICGGEATRTQRLIDGKPALYHAPVILVGGSEAYQARCILHHEVPRRGDGRATDRS